MHGLALTFASVDWIMALDPDWDSTIFGVYFIAGALAGGIAAWIVAIALAERYTPLDALADPAQHHRLGKLLFTGVCFWAYIAYSQLMLVWVANLPEEIPWSLRRLGSSGHPSALALALTHFVIPFLLLLSSQRKRRLRPLVSLAVWILAAHYLDLYWLIVPRLSGGHPALHITDLTALVGLGGLCVAFGLWRVRGHPLVPTGDPDLAGSLRYDPDAR